MTYVVSFLEAGDYEVRVGSFHQLDAQARFGLDTPRELSGERFESVPRVVPSMCGLG
jgi:hypothetical protein